MSRLYAGIRGDEEVPEQESEQQVCECVWVLPSLLLLLPAHDAFIFCNEKLIVVLILFAVLLRRANIHVSNSLLCNKLSPEDL